MISVVMIIGIVAQYAIPMNIAKKYKSKLSHAIDSPVDSYFHETMNGITVIRAFGQSESVIKKQYNLLDKCT